MNVCHGKYRERGSDRTRERGSEGGGDVPRKEGWDRAISSAKHTKMMAISPITPISNTRKRRPGLSKKERTIRTSAGREKGREGGREKVINGSLSIVAMGPE